MESGGLPYIPNNNETSIKLFYQVILPDRLVIALAVALALISLVTDSTKHDPWIASLVY